MNGARPLPFPSDWGQKADCRTVVLAGARRAVVRADARRIPRPSALRPPGIPRAAARVAAQAGAWLVALVFAGNAAHAEFRVCNNTRSLINLSIGSLVGADYATEGWWTVTPGSCATPIHETLNGRYLYLYATGIDGVDLLKGTVSMCVDRGKFKAVGIDNCWRRGLQAVNFAEIDTLGSPDWTTFLTIPGK
jgi:uncharacterized membrane protein